jgi:hypothetical protein
MMDVSKTPPTHLGSCRYLTLYRGVLDSSIIQGPFSVAPCQTLVSRFATTFASPYRALRMARPPPSLVLRCAAALAARVPASNTVAAEHRLGAAERRLQPRLEVPRARRRRLLLTHSHSHSLTNPVTHSVTHPLTHSVTHSLTCSASRSRVAVAAVASFSACSAASCSANRAAWRAASCSAHVRLCRLPV